MTLDEAIQHCEEIAMDKANLLVWNSKEKARCEDRAKEHRQLAEWLKELKGYREAKAKIESLPLVWEYGQGVEDCLAIIDKHLQEVKTDERMDTD